MSASQAFWYTGIFLFFVACYFYGFRSQSPKTPQVSKTEPLVAFSAPPVINPRPDDGYYDFDLYIERTDRQTNGSQSIVASGIYKGQLVSVKVRLSPHWKTAPQDKDVPIEVHSGKLDYVSLGTSSDSLLQMIDGAYGTGLKPKAMAKTTSFDAIALGGDPEHLEKGISKIKLFYGADSSDEHTYTEVFTNIDLPNRVLGIHEKDPEYRKAFVHALMRHP